MIIAHKIQLDPTHRQRQYFANAAGCARFVWNWALTEWERQYAAGEKPSWTKLSKQFNAVKYSLFPWLREISKGAHSRPFSELGKAYKQWFEKTAEQPRRKKKGRCRDSFYVVAERCSFSGELAKLPVIGCVRLTEPLRFIGKIMSATVSRTANKWFISVIVDVGDYSRSCVGDGAVGVDLGIKVAATLSTGEQIHSPQPLKTRLSKLKRLQRQHSRKQKGSKNRQKAQRKVAKCYAKVANVRNDFLHKLTTRLCRENQTVVIEGLNVSGMLKNRSLSRAISDQGFGEFRRRLEYKSAIYGTRLVIADRWYPSSKTCSGCGEIKQDLALKDRIYKCDHCGLSLDRDLNAAINLHTLGLRDLPVDDSTIPDELLLYGNESDEAGTRQCLFGTP